MSYTPEELELNLKKTKVRLFQGKNAAFLAPLLSAMPVAWDEKIPTAATDGLTVFWNPDFFMHLSPETRVTVLVHELWHPAYMHMVRRGTRDPKIWNQACDYRINNDLKEAGYSFMGIEWGCIDPSFDKNGRASEEEIYNELIKRGSKPKQQPSWANGAGGTIQDELSDLLDGEGDTPLTPEQIQTITNNVMRATQAAMLAGKPGDVPGAAKDTLDKFLAPVIPWERELMKFCTETMVGDYTMARPNRRYLHTGMYLPSVGEQEGRLTHLIYYVDVSGSVSDKDVQRCNSEIKYIKEELRPEKLTLVLFDTQITAEYVFNEDEPFEKLVIVGRGGTYLEPVRDHIQQHKPTAAVIFSDLECAPMQPLTVNVPVIWIGVNSRGTQVPFGKLIEINT